MFLHIPQRQSIKVLSDVCRKPEDDAEPDYPFPHPVLPEDIATACATQLQVLELKLVTGFADQIQRLLTTASNLQHLSLSCTVQDAAQAEAILLLPPHLQ